MSKTLPSPKVTIADVPEVLEFHSSFRYNFFVPDERTNDSGLLPNDFITKKSSESFDAQFISSNKFNRFAPRYVKFEWKPHVETKKIIPTGLTIKDNLKKIHYEQDFLSTDFTSIMVQDTGKDQKMNFFLRRLVQQQRNYFDTETNNYIVNESHLDIAKDLIEKTSDFIEPTLVCESLVNLEQEGYTFLNKSTNLKVDADNLLKEMKEVKTFGHINSKFLWNIMKTGLEGNLNVFEDEIIASKNNFIKISDEARKAYEPGVIRKEDYDLEIQEYVGDPRKISTDSYIPQKQILGYIIDKKEIDKDNKIIDLDSPIILENPNISTTIDLKIKYGSTYLYSIRTIAYVETQVEDIETNEFYIIGYLLSSKPSIISVTPCVEQTPPPPPADFDIRWNAENKELVLNWNFPINTQRDIKKWQIFRRRSLYDPFELIKIYDFDDSIIKMDDQLAEFPDPELIEYVTNPVNYFVDIDFKKNKITGEYPTFIYAVCSVDAHGYSSNYSLQLECSFDRYKNKLNKKLLSNSGAPKPFPNFYLLMDTFVDTMKVSNKNKSINVYFTPEYLEVINNENQELGLLKTKQDSLYKINLINLDLQEQENIEIRIQDMRRTTEKPQDVLTPSKKPRFGTKRGTKK